MSDEAKSQNSMNPVEYWKEWNEMHTQAWVNAINNGKAAGKESAGFDRSWMTGAKQPRLVVDQTLLDPGATWQLWLDSTMDIWLRAASMGGDPLGVIAAWVKVMESVQEKARSGEPLPLDPFKLFYEWYEAVSKPWSETVEDLLASEQFLGFIGPFLESYSNLMRTFRHASEAYFKSLRVPTLADITRVSELIVGLEEKIDSIEDAIEHFQEQTTQNIVPMTKITQIEQRLSQIESKLDKALTLLKECEA